ncbi:MAG TPA: cupredoxin domain-containing protein [Patescibacteria group bacterium]|jgi:plastocyanin|nr:cupredoxin domain-containing protein [Patescibacteria group bacterium]
MKKLWIIGTIILIAIAGALWFVYKNNTSPTTAPPSSSTNSTSNNTATITYSDSGFSPSVTTINSGGVVSVTNNSATELQFDSNPHPIHTDDTDLNIGSVPSGQTKTFTVTKKGSFGYHNHLSPQVTGKIIVQ